MSLTDDEIQELCLDCGLGVVIGDHFKNLARAIERIATQRALEAAAEVCAEFADAGYGAEECETAIRAMTKEVGNA